MSADIIDFETKRQKREEKIFMQQLSESKGGGLSKQFTGLFSTTIYPMTYHTYDRKEPPK